jgi:hypothetical protein
MKSSFYRLFTIAVKLVTGLTVTVLLAVLTLPDILCIASLLRAPRKALGILTLLAALSTFSAFIGCSSKNPPATEPPRVIRWKGQDSGYEDTTKPGDQASLK